MTRSPAQTAVSPGDDAERIARLRAGDGRAFDELVRLTAGRLLAVARRMLGREEDAQDAVQEAFLNAFRSLDRFDGRSQITTWLHRITVNACLMRMRAQRRRGGTRPIQSLLPEYLEDGHQKCPSQAWKPVEESGIEQAEMRELVRAKIAELPEPYRVVLLLRDIEELDTETTAELVGLSVPAVKTRLHRARQALKSLLDPYMAGATP